MTVKKWTGVVVAVAIAGALGLEIWTFSEMLWRGFQSDQTNRPTPTARKAPDDRFIHGGIDGHFKILQLRARENSWEFYCVLEASNTSDQIIHLTVTAVRLQTGETRNVTKPLILEPGTTRTVQFHLPIPPGTSPTAVRIDNPKATRDPSRWFQLPKVPVRSSS